jgi:predicted GNAT family acetyltransferase
VRYKTDLDNVDWQEMKSTLAVDRFDNGRTPKQLQESFNNSYAAVIAYANNHIIGTARVLSDGVCNAYIVDVWTLTKYRRRGIASTMMKMLLVKLKGSMFTCLRMMLFSFTKNSALHLKRLGLER